MVKSRSALVSAYNDLQSWSNAKVHGVALADDPYAQWVSRVERLKGDTSHLILRFDDLAGQSQNLHAMVSSPKNVYPIPREV